MKFWLLVGAVVAVMLIRLLLSYRRYQQGERTPCCLCGKPCAREHAHWRVQGPLCEECYIDMTRFP